ncbi:MAG TPA: Smr/MutS family protein [Patescibacteria group bacterium]|nr:Smr/MutS family protein [Patescibacteria group bacterium]
MGRRKPKEIPGTPLPAEFDERSNALLLSAEMKDDVPNVDLHGMDAYDAEQKVSEAIDKAFMNGTEVLRVIHGDGRGVLRKAVRELLAKHQFIVAWRPAPGAQGAGVTHAVIERM